ncbi:cytidine deaminase [Patescibacteria group bacterium]
MEKKTIPDLSPTDKMLILNAIEARRNAYCLYSKYAVGCAVLSESDGCYLGWNVEVVIFSTTVHAEQNAISRMPAHDRKIKTLAIACPTGGVPCGACAEFIMEFGTKETVLLGYNINNNEVTVTTLGELMHLRFKESDIRCEVLKQKP